jgi:hypothetical protein
MRDLPMSDVPAASLSSESQPPQTAGALSRRADLRLGIAVEVVTILWMLAEASIALFAGFAARSASLESFGLDSVIELVGGGVLLWRLLAEQRGRAGEALELVERRASRVVGWALYALAAYILLNAAISLITRAHPDENWPGWAWQSPLCW